MCCCCFEEEGGVEFWAVVLTMACAFLSDISVPLHDEITSIDRGTNDGHVSVLYSAYIYTSYLLSTFVCLGV